MLFLGLLVIILDWVDFGFDNKMALSVLNVCILLYYVLTCLHLLWLCFFINFSFNSFGVMEVMMFFTFGRIGREEMVRTLNYYPFFGWYVFIQIFYIFYFILINELNMAYAGVAILFYHRVMYFLVKENMGKYLNKLDEIIRNRQLGVE